MADRLGEVLNFAGAWFVVEFHWFWMAVALAIGIAVGWRVAGEAPAPEGQPAEQPKPASDQGVEGA